MALTVGVAFFVQLPGWSPNGSAVSVGAVVSTVKSVTAEVPVLADGTVLLSFTVICAWYVVAGVPVRPVTGQLTTPAATVQL